MLSLTDSDHIPHEYKIHKGVTELIYQALYSLNHKEFNSMKVVVVVFFSWAGLPQAVENPVLPCSLSIPHVHLFNN